MIAIALFSLLMLAVCVVGFARVFFVEVPYFEGHLVVNWFGGARAIGPGMRFVFRPFESVSDSRSLKEWTIDDKISVETSEAEVARLDYAIECWPSLSRLASLLSFPQGEVGGAINQRVRALLSVEARTRKRRDDVYREIELIAREVEQKFNSFFAAQYGVVIRFLIDNPELPSRLAEAEVAREVMEKINQKRGSEMMKLESMAASLVKQAKKNGQKLDFSTAYKMIQVQLGIIREANKTYGLNRDTLDALEQLLPNLLKEASHDRQ